MPSVSGTSVSLTGTSMSLTGRTFDPLAQPNSREFVGPHKRAKKNQEKAKGKSLVN